MDDIRAYFDDEDTLHAHTYDDGSHHIDRREISKGTDDELPFHIPRD